MRADILRHEIRVQRRGLTWWVIGMAIMSAYLFAMYPTIRNNTAYRDVVNAMPKAMRAMFVGSVGDVTSPTGFLTIEMFTFTFPLTLTVYGVLRGIRSIAGQERDGTLEIVLASPLSRTRFAIEQLGASALLVGAVTACVFVSLVVGSILSDMDLSIARTAAACLCAFLFAMTWGSIAFAIGTAFGRTGAAGGIAAALAVASYLIDSVAQLVTSLHWLRNASPYYWYVGRSNPLVDGLSLGHVLTPLAIISVVSAAAIWRFRTRDLGT